MNWFSKKSNGRLDFKEEEMQKSQLFNCRSWQTSALVVLFSLLLTGCSAEPEILDAFGVSSGIVRAILILVGALYLLAGFKIHHFIIQLTGFIFGGLLGAIVLAGVVDQAEGLISIVGFFIGGIIGAGLALFLEQLGVFLIGAAVGAILGATLFGVGYNSEASTMITFACIFGIVGGVIFLALYKAWIIGVTSLIGAILIGISTGAGPGMMLILFLVGVGVQYGLMQILGPAKSEIGSPSA
jgi:hypothetical protein